jgi:hypothetical protein
LRKNSLPEYCRKVIIKGFSRKTGKGYSAMNSKMRINKIYDYSSFFIWLGKGNSCKGSKIYRQMSWQRKRNSKKLYERIMERNLTK